MFDNTSTQRHILADNLLVETAPSEILINYSTESHANTHT